MAFIRLYDKAFVQCTFEAPASSFDSFAMLPFGVRGESGTLMNSIGQVRSSSLDKLNLRFTAIASG